MKQIETLKNDVVEYYSISEISLKLNEAINLINEQQNIIERLEKHTHGFTETKTAWYLTQPITKDNEDEV